MNQQHKKTAVITGATGGIGSEIAVCFLKAGVSVYLLGRNFESLRSSSIIAEGLQNNTVHFCKVELNDEAELLETVRLINNEDKIDYLIHCAAFYNYGSFKQSKIADLDTAYRVNVRAPYLLTLQLLPKLISAKGVILFLNSSVVARSGKKNVAQYASTKSALKAMADCLRKEISSDGVRVVSVILGKTATKMQRKASMDEGIPYESDEMVQPENLAQLIYQVVSISERMQVADLYISPTGKYK